MSHRVKGQNKPPRKRVHGSMHIQTSNFDSFCFVFVKITRFLSIYKQPQQTSSNNKFNNIHTLTPTPLFLHSFEVFINYSLQDCKLNLLFIMAAINQVSCFMCSSSSSSSSRRDVSRASIQFPKVQTNTLISTNNIQKIQSNIGLVDFLVMYFSS